jgi:hypothetical protein
MSLFEYAVNLHMHTPYSDGEWYHAQIAEAALRAGLDMICVTDHNVWVKGPERYYEKDGKRVLVLVGEEVHDQARQPQKNHLLVYGANRELARYAPEPQALLDAARAAGALAFLAHPFDASVPLFNYEDISWVNWEVTGYTGLEIWNYMSDWARLLTSKPNAIRYAFNPEQGVCGPSNETLAKWDALTATGQRVVGIGNSDAHATEYQMWGLRRIVFPYEFLFRQVNTHVLTETPLTGEHPTDARLLLEALASGHCFIGYDGAAATRGFRFTASSERGNALMGDEVVNRNGVTLQIAAPAPAQGSPTRARLRLLRDGQEVARWKNQTHVTHVVPAGERGAFRVEAHLLFKDRVRGWIFSNPIYMR